MIRLAVLNAYPSATRKKFDLLEVPQGHVLFQNFFQKHLPEAGLDVFYVAEAGLQNLPGTLEDYDGFVWTGSDGTIYADRPENKQQLDLMKALFQLDRPIWGSCWGLQVAALAAGGQVISAPRGREWLAARKVKVLDKEHKMLSSKPELYDGLVMHLDEVSRIPEGALLLAENGHSDVQAFSLPLGRCSFWGTQYHPEYNFSTMARLMNSREDMLLAEGCIQSGEELQNMSRALFQLEALTMGNSLNIDVVQNDPDIKQQAQILDLHWSIFHRQTREIELHNWVEFELKKYLRSK